MEKHSCDRCDAPATYLKGQTAATPVTVGTDQPVGQGGTAPADDMPIVARITLDADLCDTCEAAVMVALVNASAGVSDAAKAALGDVVAAPAVKK